MIITTKLKDGTRFLSLSILSLSGWAGMLNPVQALSVSQCTFTNITPGTIVKSSTGLKALEASTGFFGGSNDGITGSVDLDCNRPNALVSIGLPTLNSAPATFNPTISQALVQDINNPTATGTSITNGGGPFNHAPWAGQPTAPFRIGKGPQTLRIGMIVGDNSIGSPPGGFYSYSTVLTVVPN